MHMSLRTIPALTAVIRAAGIVAHPVLPPQGTVPAPRGQTRTYYLAAAEVAWDYAPSTWLYDGHVNDHITAGMHAGPLHGHALRPRPRCRQGGDERGER
jgi:hypothetical protein